MSTSDELPELSEGDVWFIIGWLEDAEPAVYQRAIASLRDHRARVEQQQQHRQARVATALPLPPNTHDPVTGRALTDPITGKALNACPTGGTVMTTDTNNFDITQVTAHIAGVTYHLTVEQFDYSAYIQVWGGDIDCDASVSTTDAMRAISDAADGANNYDAETVAILLLAADVLTHAATPTQPTERN